MIKASRLLLFLFLLLTCSIGFAQAPGYELWMDYAPITNEQLANQYQAATTEIAFVGSSEVLAKAEQELLLGLNRMLGSTAGFSESWTEQTTLLVAKTTDLPEAIGTQLDLNRLQAEGFLLRSTGNIQKPQIVLTALDDLGILYGTFRLLHYMQAGRDLQQLDVLDAPKVNLRMLNHWDNLDRTVERGYAGASLWNWHKLPGYIEPRYEDYARANASIGINGTVLTNVNANALVLTPMYLEKVAALANVFRPYGIKVYLTARFSAPIEIGGLATADPLDAGVRAWWKAKADEIYATIPDFGGFLVKANSEGQPGPQNYGRSHAEGANMLAEALDAHGGVVIWRAFVYSELDPTDRAKQAYAEFVPSDGSFRQNVLVQSKNGPIDFQPREPFHPMFGAMPETPLMMEFQVTQEYLGFSTHLAFLPKLYEEVLQSDTYRKGKGSTVAKVIDGSLHGKRITGMAGVSNIGSDLNWTGHPFGQANWYGFGRLAWDPHLSADQIADEWLRLTYSDDPAFLAVAKPMMLESREAVVNYMTPLGLAHLFDTDHHYGPGPWVNELGRPEWNPTYYHKADSLGIGFNRTPSGTNSTSQYAPEVQAVFTDLKSCPEEYLLWFHHLPWDYTLKNGRTLWDGMALQYQLGVDQVEEMIVRWEKAKAYVTKAQYEEVRMLLDIQLEEARWWKDACLSYFQTFSRRPLPEGVDAPKHSLDYYKSLKFPFAPGIRPKWD